MILILLLRIWYVIYNIKQVQMLVYLHIRLFNKKMFQKCSEYKFLQIKFHIRHEMISIKRRLFLFEIRLYYTKQ